VAVAKALLAAHPGTDVIISDDGLQHYALGRDVEILMFDQRGVGNGWLLPAGPLRESVSRRRDFTILNAATELVVPGVDAEAIRMRLIPGKLYQLAFPENKISFSQFAAESAKFKQIAAVAGIGHPERFFQCCAMLVLCSSL